jgi:hypothetical protein
MRDAPRLILVTVLFLGFLEPISAQTVLYRATVKAPGARIRSGAGSDAAYYDTAQLKQGEVVEVVRELEGGWLAIVPPKGSFSWIEATNLRPLGQNYWTVAVDPLPVLVGSELMKNTKPTVVGDRLQRGSQVIALTAVQMDGKTPWLPISPTPSEVRYVRADAVTRETPTAASGAVAALPPTTWDGGKSLLTTLPKVVTSAAPAGDVDGLIQQARLRESEHNWAEAARLYEQVAALSTANPVLAQQSRARAAWDLQQGGQSVQPTQTPAQSSVGDAYQFYLRTVQLDQQGKREEAAQGYERLGEMFARTDYKRSSEYFARAAWLRNPASATTSNSMTDTAVRPASAQSSTATPSVRTPQTPEPRAISAKSSGPGRLAHSSERIDGKPTYILEGANESFYVTAEPGLVLDGYVGKDVELLGQFVPHPEYRIRTMSVKFVIPLVKQ